jgi:nucleolar protein 56
MADYILYESAAGYSIFQRLDAEIIGSQLTKVQESWLDFDQFSQVVSLTAFLAFPSPEIGLENINDISEGILNPFLKDFLESTLSSNYTGITLGVVDALMGTSIEESLHITCIKKDGTVLELLRFIRYHFESFLKRYSDRVSTEEAFLFKSQRGLAHSYSRAKVKFNIHKSDNMIIQSISLLDQMDKDINTFSMRVREWYSWHFPELIKIVNDNILYARLVKLVQNRKGINRVEHFNDIVEILGDEEKAELVIQASKSSMGYDISDYDMKNITNFADRVASLAVYRQDLASYLHKKMMDISPNLTTLVGDIVGARLINRAGSLISLAKYPASTVQILGAEKALFRALKNRSQTPKYGLIYNSSFITRAKTRDKGRISRYLANKCVMASRIDAFSEFSTTKFGEALRQQVLDRLKFYESGVIPAKNIEIMHAVVEEVKNEQSTTTKTPMEQEEQPEEQQEEEPEEQPEEQEEEEPKKVKKSRKSRKNLT